jgi:pSer/pThr/pTyr-binding forkhead associated (FHA) protein
MAVRCVLVLPEGPSRRVGPSGILIGRQADCDIVAADPSVSRRHAHVRLTQDGAEVVPLGRAPIDVNGTPQLRPRALADGDELRVPGLVLKVVLSQEPEAVERATGFVLERAGGGNFGVVTSPFAIGGGSSADLIIASWPEPMFVMHVAQGELFVQALAEGATLNAQELDVDEPTTLTTGDLLAYRDETFEVKYFAGFQTTTAVKRADLPVKVAIEMLPRGGRITFTSGDGEHAVNLADRRLDLLIALLRPPEGYKAGDWIPDDVVRSIVWPRNPGVSRPEINTLISRCRRDLVQAGLAGPRLIERAPTGGGTRIALAPGASIEVR